MHFNVSTLLQQPIGSRRRYALAAEPFDFYGHVTTLSGDVDLLRTDGSILATTRLRATITERCSDCLRPVPVSLDVAFSEEFWPEYQPITRERVLVPEEREGFPIVGGILDLTEAVRQYIEMTRPMRPLCGPACPGVGSAAPQRGEEREAGDDRRWQALKALRGDLE